MSVKTIVQIGAGIGKDHVTQFIGEDLYLVEANPLHKETLEKEYPNGRVVIKAVVPSNKVGEVTLWYAESGAPEHQHCSTNKQHLIKHKHKVESIKSFTVDGVTLETLLDELELKDIDILFLDIEGLEEDIINEFPFQKYNIREFQVETLHMKNCIGIKDVFKRNGYKDARFSYERKGYDKLYRKC